MTVKWVKWTKNSWLNTSVSLARSKNHHVRLYLKTPVMYESQTKHKLVL